MPIEFQFSSESTKVSQSFVSPTVYLDHWALRIFSDDLELQNRFVSILLHFKGTLLLSIYSFAEFARNDDIQHSIAAEKFLERLLPNIYFTDSALDKLDEQEQHETSNVRRFWPPADLPQLKLFAERAPNAPQGFTMQGFIRMARENYSVLEPVTKETLQEIRTGLELLRADPEYVKKARGSLPNSKRTRTKVIMAELMREFILDTKIRMSDNDLMDMLHAAISVNCCDYVLLDSAWTDRVSKITRRIKKSGDPMPIAKSYSRKNNGVLQFLDDLSAYKP